MLAHPECPKAVLVLADHVGSTAALLKYAQQSDADTFIVATESGILHQMHKSCPEKISYRRLRTNLDVDATNVRL